MTGLVLASALLIACRGEPQPIEGAPDEPVAAVEALATALRDGDLERYARLSVPPARFEQQAALWRREADALDPGSDAAKRYDALMAELLAPDAEAALWAKAEPRLAAMSQELGPKWTMGVTMLTGFATTAISADERLSEPQKSHATAVVQALGDWAGEQATFTDPARAKTAIGIAVRTAHELELPTVDAARALDYPTMLGKAGVAFRGGKALAAAYGIDADAALGQVQAEVIALDGPRATVRVRYPLLGKDVSFEQPMLQIDGGWYREDALQALDTALAEAGPIAPSPAAPVADAAPVTDAAPAAAPSP